MMPARIPSRVHSGYILNTDELYETCTGVKQFVITIFNQAALFPLRFRHEFHVSERPVESVEPVPSYESTPQDAGFLACLCAKGENYLMILCCFPLHLKAAARKKICRAHEEVRVILEGEETSKKPLTKKDEIFFSLPDALTPCEEKDKKDRFLRYVFVNVMIFLYFLKHSNQPSQQPSNQPANRPTDRLRNFRHLS